MVDDAALNFHVQHTQAWLGRSEAAGWWRTIMEHARWFRVKYKSARFGSDCETPCWTTFFGGSAEVAPYTPVPAWLQPLVSQVSARCGGAPFNAMLLRLYIDGNDRRGPRH